MKVEKYFKNKSVDINARQHASLRKRNFKREPDRITLIARKKFVSSIKYNMSAFAV